MRRGLMIAWLVAPAACASEDPAPPPVITAIEPPAICPNNENDPELVRVSGSGFVIDDDHTVQSVVELWRSGRLDTRKVPLLEADLEGRRLILAFANGESAPAASEPPVLFEVRVVNPDGQTAIFDGLGIHSSFGFATITPTVASVGSRVTLSLQGSGFYDPMRVRIESQTGTDADEVVVTSSSTATASFDLSGVPAGTYAVSMRNAGGCRFSKVSAFTITP